MLTLLQMDCHHLLAAQPKAGTLATAEDRLMGKSKTLKITKISLQGCKIREERPEVANRQLKKDYLD